MPVMPFAHGQEYYMSCNNSRESGKLRDRLDTDAKVGAKMARSWSEILPLLGSGFFIEIGRSLNDAWFGNVLR